MRSQWSRGGLVCYTLMAGAQQGQGGRGRKRMGKRQEVEEGGWCRRRQEWRQRMGMGWRVSKGIVKEGIHSLSRSPQKVWGPCCSGRLRGWRSAGREWVEGDGWGQLVLWCLIFRPTGMREEHANTNKKQITTQHTILMPLRFGLFHRLYTV